jgi:sulfane dehydrogenase subunit SoxC
MSRENTTITTRAENPIANTDNRDDNKTNPVDRRTFLKNGAALVGATVAGGVVTQAAGQPLEIPASMKTPGEPFSGYGTPAAAEQEVARGVLQPYGDTAPGAGVSMTPLQSLDGTITPNGLHFERHHNGVPQIDPSQHRLLIHGLVERNLTFSMETLLRYPRVSRICFIECSGNSFFNAFPEPNQMPCGMIHGLVSNTEWSGVPLKLLLEEAGVDPRGQWILAEGADAAGMSRSVPLSKAMDDALIAFYQNGERIRPEQGYPMRLVLPGWEGNMCVKWLRRIKVTEGPTHTKDETSKYSDLKPDGSADQFTFVMGAKSVITFPSTGLNLNGAGFYEISGLAWSGAGAVSKVEVSTDGGQNWAEAELQGPVLPQALTRFRLGWQWDGSERVIQSRATDDQGNTQQARADWKGIYHGGNFYHYNAIQSWRIDSNGEVSNVYA